MCVWQASGRSIGKSSSPSWVEVMIAPLGLRIWMGFWVGRLFKIGHQTLMQVDVHPESAYIGCFGSGGAGGTGEPLVGGNKLLILCTIGGSPRP
jgi:hypothetical protein